MKLIRFIFFILSAVLTVGAVGTVPVRADAPYKTYTVDGNGMVTETQTAYLPYRTITKIGDTPLKAPRDFFLLDDGTIYVLDSGNKRVVVADPEGDELLSFGSDVLVSPRGMFVTQDGSCYVADRDAKKIFVFGRDGSLVTSYGRPVEAMYGDGLDFLPLKVIVNKAGTIYAICESNTNGIVEISPVDGGTFLGYFGTNSADSSIFRIIWRALLTEAQRAKQPSNQPPTPDNMAIDDKGIIYTVTRGEGSESLKRLNIAGGNMIEPKMSEQLPAAVTPGNHDNVFVVSQTGNIYEYNNEGDLLFVFGGPDDGDARIGLSTKAESIRVGADDKVYVLDSDKAQIQIYEPTEFAGYLHEALFLFSKGRYEESKTPLLKVLEMNNLFDYANMAMSKALYKEGDNEGALRYAKLAKDKECYSDAFWEIRNNWLKHNLTWIVLTLIAIAILVRVIKVLDAGYGILKKPKAFFSRLGQRRLVRQVNFMFYFMRHPIEGCYRIKRLGAVSIGSTNILLSLVIVFYVINKYFCGFLIKTVRDGSFDIFSDIGMILLLLGLVSGCNYLMCTINDGEARFRDIYCTLVYSFAPYIVFTPVLFLLSHAVTENEEFFTSFGSLAMIVWISVLVFISIREINDFTVGETFKIIGLTVFTMLIVCLLGFIIYVLWSQVFDFLQQIPREVVYRIGN